MLLMGFVGMAVDAGFVYHSKARLRAASDAAALAAVNSVSLNLPARLYTDLSQISPGLINHEKINFDIQAKEIIDSAIKGAQVKTLVSHKPFKVTVISKLAVKSYFSKIFGIKKWNVSVASAAVLDLASSVGFEDLPLETGGVRPLALKSSALDTGEGSISGAQNSLINTKIVLSNLSKNFESPYLAAVFPLKNADFNALVRAAEYGCTSTVKTGDNVFIYSNAFNAVREKIMLSPDKKITICVVHDNNPVHTGSENSGSYSENPGSYKVTGFLKALFSVNHQSEWILTITDILRPRPKLVL
jgi:hypothetical protein